MSEAKNIPSERPRVLLVAEVESDRTALRGYLATVGADIATDEVLGNADVVAMATANVYDCIVVDGEHGLVTRIHDAKIATPIVWLARDDMAGAGPTDVIVKAQLTPGRFARSVVAAIRLARAERSAARVTELESLFSVVSHDVRGPLNAINVALEALGDDTVTGDDRARYVAAVRRSIDRANRMLTDLMTNGTRSGQR